VFLTEKVFKWGNICEENVVTIQLPQKCIAILLMFGENFEHFLKTVTSKSQIYLGVLNDSYIRKLKNKKNTRIQTGQLQNSTILK
jgi:hypothetical protein